MGLPDGDRIVALYRVGASPRVSRAKLQPCIQLQTAGNQKPSRKKCAADFRRFMVWLRINTLRGPGLPSMGLEHFGEESAIRSGLNGRICEVSAAALFAALRDFGQGRPHHKPPYSSTIPSDTGRLPMYN
jgi:hypothetical protein